MHINGLHYITRLYGVRGHYGAVRKCSHRIINWNMVTLDISMMATTRRTSFCFARQSRKCPRLSLSNEYFAIWMGMVYFRKLSIFIMVGKYILIKFNTWFHRHCHSGCHYDKELRVHCLFECMQFLGIFHYRQLHVFLFFCVQYNK